MSYTNQVKKSLLKTLLVIGIIALIVVLGYFVCKFFGLDNLEDLKKIVDNSFAGMLIFVIILILQVIFLPAGTLVFSGSAVVLFDSPLKAWLICWFGLAIGSWIMFWIARIWGVKVLKWIVGQERAEKYAYYLGRGKFVLPMILLVPIFPDDLICAASGLSNINWLYFMIVVFITRGIDNFCTVFIGAELIKSAVGIILLCIFIVIMIIASYFLTKYQDKIENYFLEKFSSKSKKIANNNVLNNKDTIKNTTQQEQKKDNIQSKQTKDT